MSLSESIISDASVVFLNTSDFAEAVTYHPHKYYGDTLRADRVISAVVIRQQLSPSDELDGVVLPAFEVHVANSSTVGISSDELDLGGDRIEFPPRDGKAAEERTIVALTSQDSGMLVLECR